MRLIIALFIHISFNTLYAQDVKFNWVEPDNETKSRFEQSIKLGKNRAIIIPNSMEKPIGLKPYLYTYDPVEQSVDCKMILGWKNMETYREFFNSNSRYVGDDKNIYRIACELGKAKKGVRSYALSIEELDEGTLRSESSPLVVLPERNTESSGFISGYLNDNYLAVVMGSTAIFNDMRSVSNRPIEVFVFNRAGMELMYQQEYTIGKEHTISLIHQMELQENGEFHFTVIEHDIQIKNMADAKAANDAPNEVHYVSLSEKGIDEEVIFQGLTTLYSASTQVPGGGNLAVAFSKNLPIGDPTSGELQLHVTQWVNGVKNVNSLNLPWAELFTIEKASFSQSFIDKIDESEQLFMKVLTARDVLDAQGNLIQSVTLKVTTSDGLGLANTLFTCLVTKISPNGDILWANFIPAIGGLNVFGVDHAMLVDRDQNIRILSNGIKDEYPNGNYSPNQKIEMSPEYLPVEVTLNGEDGNIISNKLQNNGFSDGEGFSPHHFVRLSNNAYLVGKNKKGRLVNSSTMEDQGIIYGLMYVD